MLKLKGHGESSRIKCDHCGQCFDTDVTGVFSRCDNCQTDVPINVQPADDPRKAMLEEIRAELRGLILVQAKGLPAGYPCEWVDRILDEMEAKL